MKIYKISDKLFLESNRKTLSWINFIIILLSGGNILYNFLIDPSLLLFSILIVFVILWVMIFRTYGGFRKYLSYSFGSIIQLDIEKWYGFNDKEKEYQTDIMTWLDNNNIKYYKNFGSTFYFLKKTDSMAFKLRWI